SSVHPLEPAAIWARRRQPFVRAYHLHLCERSTKRVGRLAQRSGLRPRVGRAGRRQKWRELKVHATGKVGRRSHATPSGTCVKLAAGPRVARWPRGVSKEQSPLSRGQLAVWG